MFKENVQAKGSVSGAKTPRRSISEHPSPSGGRLVCLERPSSKVLRGFFHASSVPPGVSAVGGKSGEDRRGLRRAEP
jgi:hypothetical protein